MIYAVIINPEVSTDLEKVISWYDERVEGLGHRFYEEVNLFLNLLEIQPNKFAVRYDDVHCLPINKFPYMIHYRIDELNHFVFIEAILHTSRNPTRWKKKNQ